MNDIILHKFGRGEWFATCGRFKTMAYRSARLATEAMLRLLGERSIAK